MGNGGGFGSWACGCVKRSFEGTLGRASTATGIFAILLLPLAAWGPEEWKPAVTIAPFWIFFSLFLILFFVGLARVVFGQVCTLQQKNDQLERERRPKISWLGPIIWTEPKETVSKADRRVCRVRVKNDSNADVERVSVKLISMVNNENKGTRNDGEKFWPKGAREHEGDFDLNPGDSRDVDLFLCQETKEDDAHVWMCYVSGYKGVPRTLCPHEMLIRASAKSCTPIEMKIKFAVDETGILRVERTDVNRPASQSLQDSIRDRKRQPA